MRVREPAGDGHSVLRMKDVRGGRVVNDDCFAKVTADLGKILNVHVSDHATPQAHSLNFE